MDYKLQKNSATEIIRLKVSPERTEDFINGRYFVDEFMQTLNGFIGTDLLQSGDEDWLVLIRWETEEAVLAAQKITSNSEIISTWLGTTRQFISFETAYLRYSKNNNEPSL